MINEAPKPNLKQKVATTKKSGQTLKNFRLSQKDSQDARDRAKRASAQAPAGGAVKTQSSAPYSAQNYKVTMAKRKADQKKAAASAAQKTKAVPTGQPYQAKSAQPQQQPQDNKKDNEKDDKKDGILKKTGKVLKTVGKYGKKLAKGGAVAGLGAAAMAVPVVALHMGEGRNMRTLRDVREKYTQKQRIMRDMGRNRGKDSTGMMKAKIAKDADERSKSYPGGGAPVRDKDIKRRAAGGYGGHEIERGVKKKDYDYVPVSRDKLDSPDRPSPAERLKRKKEKDARQMKMTRASQMGSKRSNIGGIGVREGKMVTGNESGMMFKVSIEGLPDMIMMGKSPGEIKGQLRKIVKQPSMIQGVDRMPKSKVKMMYRDIVSGRDDEE